MIENEFYSRAVHGPYETFNIGDLVLEDGGTLRQCKLAYASFGKTDEQGNGTVTEQRLYQLIRQPKPIAERSFEIEFLDSGVEVFAFTFG
ncbi:MAG TPA: hypothetical protein VEM14_08225 [Gemmatimonadaceae bacterium]|nr:hypothetical protein [Gemmatimonadaceae bacterium]